MAEFKKQNESGTRDYRERYEFKLTVGNNIICQRYFKINNFNPRSLKSFELVDTIRNCANIINEDLTSKTKAYLEIFAPMYFNSIEAMDNYFLNPQNKKRMRPGLGIVVAGQPNDFVWGKNDTPVPCSFKFDDGELYNRLTDDDRVMYKFAFCVDGREVCSTVWEGVYPKYIRNSIDLSNRRGKHEGEDINRLSFEQYLDYKIVEGRNDLVYGLIKDICYTCSASENSEYTTKSVYGKTKYDNIPDYSLWVNPDGTLKSFKKK